MDAIRSNLFVNPTLGQDPSTLAGANTKGARDIEKVATGFESLFLTQMLKEMRNTLEPGTLFGQDSGDVFGGMFDMFMSQHLAPSGALGIAAMVRRQLAAKQYATDNRDHTTPTPPARSDPRRSVPASSLP